MRVHFKMAFIFNKHRLLYLVWILLLFLEQLKPVSTFSPHYYRLLYNLLVTPVHFIYIWLWNVFWYLYVMFDTLSLNELYLAKLSEARKPSSFSVPLSTSKYLESFIRLCMTQL